MDAMFLKSLILTALVLLSASSVIGLLLYGLFVFNLSETAIPLKSPLLTVVDICLQMFVSLLQFVAGSMMWKLRTKDQDPPLLVGIQRGGVLIVVLQVLIILMFGLVNDFVLFRMPYVICCLIFAMFLAIPLWNIWTIDILTNRTFMLRVATKFNLVASLMCALYLCLKSNHILDSFTTSSQVFIEVTLDGSLYPVGGAVLGLLLQVYIMHLWWRSPFGDSTNPISSDYLRRIVFWNLVCAAFGLAGPPITIPCLVSSVLAGATIKPRLSTATEEVKDIFYPAKNRFDMEF